MSTIKVQASASVVTAEPGELPEALPDAPVAEALVGPAVDPPLAAGEVSSGILLGEEAGEGTDVEPAGGGD